jgi:SAM-dependent methyltransferase
VSEADGKWEGKAQAYAETFALLCARLVEPLLEALSPAPGARLLDVGTGTGSVAAAALERGCRVVAVDPEPDMLVRAAHVAPRAELICDGLPALSLITGRFDAITANCVVNQLREPEASLRRLGELLTGSGRLVVSTWPARHPLQQLWNDVVAEAGAEIPAGADRAVDATGFERTLDGVTNLVARSGLQIERAWTHNFVHVVDPQLWWSGPARGVAWIGQVYRAQSPAAAAAMEAAYHRLSARHRRPDGMLELPATAIFVLAGHPDAGS